MFLFIDHPHTLWIIQVYLFKYLSYGSSVVYVYTPVVCYFPLVLSFTFSTDCASNFISGAEIYHLTWRSMKLAFWNAGSRVFLNVERTSYKEKDPAYIFSSPFLFKFL